MGGPFCVRVRRYVIEVSHIALYPEPAVFLHDQFPDVFA